ncbi:hypothetical protein CCP3SC1AL1_1980005 [Gammaproteobacteria bacterium]
MSYLKTNYPISERMVDQRLTFIDYATDMLQKENNIHYTPMIYDLTYLYNSWDILFLMFNYIEGSVNDSKIIIKDLKIQKDFLQLDIQLSPDVFIKNLGASYFTDKGFSPTPQLILSQLFHDFQNALNTSIYIIKNIKILSVNVKPDDFESLKTYLTRFKNSLQDVIFFENKIASTINQYTIFQQSYLSKNKKPVFVKPNIQRVESVNGRTAERR